MAFPGQRMADDGVEIVELRVPVQHFADAICGGDRHHDIAGPARAEVHRERMADRAANRIQHLPYRIAAPVTAVEGGAGAAVAEIRQSRDMGAREIADMDEIADAG